MSKIALVRHGQSVWNLKNLWTGWRDVTLTKKGKEEAKSAAQYLKDIDFDHFFTSDLIRAAETLKIIKAELRSSSSPTVSHPALKERHYGEFTGKNKWEIQEKVGIDHFRKLRRGWDTPIKDGETLKDVFARVVPYFQDSIMPNLKKGRNVLLVAHGNTIRALIKHFENISNEGIETIELTTGEVIIYEFDTKGKIINKVARRRDPDLIGDKRRK